jgi:hypothetical protein
MPASGVHFNGSVNLPDGETVMREISARVPRGVRRMTDGETGERGYWIVFQIQRLGSVPELEQLSSHQGYDTGDSAPEILQFKLADGASADAVQWGDIGYATAYQRSFEQFETLQQAGTIAAGLRLQLQYPTPVAVMAGTIVPEDLPAVTASYERALFADLQRALTELPHERIAVQWDVAVEFGLLEANKLGQDFGAWPRASLPELLPALVRCIDEVPADVPVGMHLCYGDYGHQHFIQPESLALQVELVNAVVADARRPVNWFSFTVPQARSDDAYFMPLEGLWVSPETELYFALVPYHPDDQPVGTTEEQSRLIDTHLPSSPAGAREWGICTECGMGRVDQADIPKLLDLHRELLAAHAG